MFGVKRVSVPRQEVRIDKRECGSSVDEFVHS